MTEDTLVVRTVADGRDVAFALTKRISMACADMIDLLSMRG